MVTGLVSTRTATAYSRDTDPMTTVSRPSKTRWWRFVLAALAAALVALLGAGTASATTPTAAETRVGASTPATAYVVGVHESVSAGQRWGNAPPNAEIVAATGVAANTAGLEARAAEVHGVLDPIAQNSRTTAVLSTREGVVCSRAVVVT